LDIEEAETTIKCRGQIVVQCMRRLRQAELIAEDVFVGNNIAVRAESSDVEAFWIMLVDKGLHVVQNPFTDASGSEFVPGDHVIRGY